MQKMLVKYVGRLSVVVALTLGVSGRAGADSLLLSNVQVNLDPANLFASISSGLEAHSDTGDDVFLDGIDVTLLQDGQAVDLFAGTTTADFDPFFNNTPPFLSDGGTLAPVVLFRILGLVPGASVQRFVRPRRGSGHRRLDGFCFRGVARAGTCPRTGIDSYLLGTGLFTIAGLSRWRLGPPAHKTGLVPRTRTRSTGRAA